MAEFTNLVKKANEGCRIAQYYLGLVYKTGEGIGINIKPNYKMAFYYFKKSANNYSKNTSLSTIEYFPKSYYEIGLCYKYGKGVEQNYNQSYEWLTKAFNIFYYLLYKVSLENEYSFSKIFIIPKDVIYDESSFDQPHYYDVQYELGLCYIDGKGIDKNEQYAYELFHNVKKSAKYNTDLNTIQLALCYNLGKGVEKNEVLAYKMFYKLLETTKCKCNCEGKRIIINNLKAYYEKKSKNKSALSYDRNIPIYLYNLGVCHNMLDNFEEALYYYEESANQKLPYAPAQYVLGCFYQNNITLTITDKIKLKKF